MLTSSVSFLYIACARVQSQTKKEKQIQERDESTQMIINVVTFSAITIDGCTRQENITLAQTGLALISNSNPWIKKCSDILPMVVQSVVNALLVRATSIHKKRLTRPIPPFFCHSSTEQMK